MFYPLYSLINPAWYRDTVALWCSIALTALQAITKKGVLVFEVKFPIKTGNIDYTMLELIVTEDKPELALFLSPVKIRHPYFATMPSGWFHEGKRYGYACVTLRNKRTLIDSLNSAALHELMHALDIDHDLP